MRKITLAKIKKKSSFDNKGPKIFLEIAIILFCLHFLCFEASAMLDLNIAPSLVSNSGTDKVKFSWYVYPGFEIAEYTIKVSNGSTVIFLIRYSVNDTILGGSYPLIGSYVWTVPKDQAEGRYAATLELGSRFDLPPSVYSVPFVIADEEEVAKLRAEGASALTEEVRYLATEAQMIAEQKAEDQRMAEQKAEDQMIAEQEAEVQRMAEREAEARMRMEDAEAQRIAEQEAEVQRIAEQEAEVQRIAEQEAEAWMRMATGILISFFAVFIILRKRGRRNG